MHDKNGGKPIFVKKEPIKKLPNTLCLHGIETNVLSYFVIGPTNTENFIKKINISEI